MLMKRVAVFCVFSAMLLAVFGPTADAGKKDKNRMSSRKRLGGTQRFHWPVEGQRHRA